jgi:hypothetical protein
VSLRTFILCGVTALVTAGVLTGFGLAERTTGQATPNTPAQCGSRTEGSGTHEQQIYVCTLKTMPTARQEPFEMRLPAIDVKCDAYAADTSHNISASLHCDRLSLSSIKCVDGVFGSFAVVLSPRRYEINSPQSCITQAKPPGYKLTSRYTPHVVLRNP